MSLLYWLPLNGNVKNYGNASYFFTGNPIFDNTGKTGVSFNCSSPITTTFQDPITYTDLTICSWVKVQTLNNENGWAISLNNENVKKGIWLNCGNKTIGWNDTNLLTFDNNETNFFNNSKWHHLAITKKNLTFSLYIDGIKISDTNFNNESANINCTSITIGDNNLNYIFLNDVQIYDSCLSQTAINILSKGLVLHWKLDNLIFPGDDSSGRRNNGNINGIISAATSSARYSNAFSLKPNSYIITKSNTFNWYDVKQGTISAWIKLPIDAGGSVGLIVSPQEEELNYKIFSLISYQNKIKLIYSDGETNNFSDFNQILNDNKWHFCAVTFLDNYAKLYFDGNKIGDNIQLNLNNIDFTGLQFQIGMNLLQTENYFTGDYSDIRLYTTPLLDKDIKMLYNTNMRIDNLGGIHTFEFKEDNNIFKLTSSGILKSDSFQEIGNIATIQQNPERRWCSPNFMEY